MKKSNIILIAFVLCLSSFGQTEQDSSKIGIDFFASDELLQITLCFDIREFIRTKNKPQNYDATLTIMLSPADSLIKSIKVKARGEMRRQYCQFPPLMLKFNKDSGKAVNLKLVTHCMHTTLNERYVLKEYLTYKLFNQVTPYSFRTRLVKVRYVDINKPEKAFTAFGFIIENEEKMAERNKAVVITNPDLTQKQMNTVDMARIAIFNFMIGNTDWSVPRQHNIRILKSVDVNSVKGIPVAYDFDYSGLVNTAYSIPNEELPIDAVTERHYLGVCYNEAELKPIFDEMTGLHDDILGTINRFEFLSEKDKKPVRAYIESFYKKYTQHDMLLSEFNNTCKKL